jgi:hypothetical protein
LQVQEALDLGLVAGAFGLAAAGRGGEVEEGERDRRAGDRVDDGASWGPRHRERWVRMPAMVRPRSVWTVTLMMAGAVPWMP